MTRVTLDELHLTARHALVAVDAGEQLTSPERALIRFGLASSVTALDERAIDDAIAAAFDEGVSPAQLQEVVSLVSGLGVHSLMATMARLACAAGSDTRPLTSAEQALWDRHVGDDPFWTGFEVELPGFLAAMLRMSPGQFTAFFEYCAVPWASRHVRARLKELIAMACDATPAHRFAPGFRLHLHNAIKLGAGREAVLETLALAAEVPAHAGWG